MSERLKSLRDLRVYAKALKLQREISEVSTKFPKQETYALTDQIRRSARSIGANIPNLAKTPLSASLRQQAFRF